MDIIEAAVLPWVQKHFVNANWTLQQDSAPVCKTKQTQEGCKANFSDMISSEECHPTLRLSIPWITETFCPARWKLKIIPGLRGLRGVIFLWRAENTNNFQKDFKKGRTRLSVDVNRRSTCRSILQEKTLHFFHWSFTASTTQRIDITKRVSLASSIENCACFSRNASILGTRSISCKSSKKSYRFVDKLFCFETHQRT
ncbi:hypothetical protein TNCV_1374541 [Trichonephila clavipes]|nr:hypothetical protein TNCV_1374541 [Trichonephila clavipes]